MHRVKVDVDVVTSVVDDVDDARVTFAGVDSQVLVRGKESSFGIRLLTRFLG